MKKQIDLIGTLIGAIIFNFIFWHERLALNVLLYAIFISIVIFWDRTRLQHKKVWLSGLAHLLAASLVVYNNSSLTLISWYTSLAIFIGFAYESTLKSIVFAISTSILQAIAVPVTLIQRISIVKIGNFSLQPLFRSIKYIVIPIFLVLVFGIIYSFASPDLSYYFELAGNFIADNISLIFNFFFADISLARIFFFLFGLFATAALFISYRHEPTINFEASLTEQLFRNRKQRKRPILSSYQYQTPLPKRKVLGLKVENAIGIISFAALNLLLLLLNTIDISNLWLSKTVNKNFNHSNELHDGTNALIGSIVLAMIVILYFFRSNLNFYKNNKYIKILTYIWIVQNTFLVASVLLKDYNYIYASGLTYKRIGVLVFLLLCLIGLVTVYLKVQRQKTLFYLLKTNGLIWYILLLFFSFFNWDVIIMKYNIKNQYEIVADLPHFWRMSDKVIPVMDALRSKTQSTFESNPSLAQNELNHLIDTRIIWFKERYKKTSWLSWNYRDWQTNQYLESYRPASLKTAR